MPNGVKKGNRPKRPKGRPTLQRAQTMTQDIRKYFDDGYSAYFCWQETGYKKDTIYKKFKDWTDELRDKTDFLSMQQEVKSRLVSTLDRRLKVYNDQIEFLIQKRTDKFNSNLEAAITRANYSLSRLILDKANIMITPMLEHNLRKMINERWGVDIDKIAEEIKLEQSQGV